MFNGRPRKFCSRTLPMLESSVNCQERIQHTIYSTMSIARNKMKTNSSNRRSTFRIRSIQQCQLPGTKFSIHSTMSGTKFSIQENIPTICLLSGKFCRNTIKGKSSKIHYNTKSSEARCGVLLGWLPYCSPGVVLMISESPENRIQSLFISIFWSKHQIDLWYGVAIYQDQ
jgi:hypothetical protein